MIGLLGWYGRTARRPFVLTFAIGLAAGCGIVIVAFGSVERGGASDWPTFLLTGLGLFAIGWVQVMATVRRLHDIGGSGWYAGVLAVIALIGSSLPADAAGRVGLQTQHYLTPGLQIGAALVSVFVLIMLMLWPGQAEANRFSRISQTQRAGSAAKPRARPVLPRPKPKLPSRIPASVPVRMAPPPRTSFGQRPSGLAPMERQVRR